MYHVYSKKKTFSLILQFFFLFFHFLYKQFFLWFFLLILWSGASPRSGVRLLPFVALNAAIALYGIQFALPSVQMEVDTFCILGALLNLFLLFLRERTIGKTSMFGTSAFRLAPLFFAGLFLLAGAIVQTLSGNGGMSFLYCLFFTVAAVFFYCFKLFDWRVCRFILAFCILWITVLLYYGVERFSLPVEQNRAFFFSAESLIIMAGIIIERRLSFQLKGRE